ncbi:MAG TPA: beta-ketoacyl-[acyl-carrier-protein] synthase family protein [Thermoguttaceae bacterium]|nr:beta-ketoacyl-[acyl-carrier-protein] synthase family protein [Thermoguttaceae bacterium]
MHQQRRVVITGMGAICPLGSTIEQLWDGLVSGRSGVSLLTDPGAAGLPVRFAAQAAEFTGKIECFGPLDNEQKKAIRKGLKVMCRECQMGVAVAQLALGDAGIAPGSLDPTRTGINFGVDYMLSVPEEFIEGIRGSLGADGRFEFEHWPGRGIPQMSPLWLLKYLPNMPASHLAIYNDLRGPNNSITQREASANMAIGEATHLIAEGRADRMLAGATGTRLHNMKMIHCVQQGELASPAAAPAQASRPFDRDRTGMVLGEGAGAIMLEEIDAARSRGATIHGEVLGAASTSAIGPNLTARPREALVNALRAVLADAGMTPEEVGHIHAHGLATRSSDVAEAQAIVEVFGSRKTPVPVVTAKGHLGNLGAGSGMIELVASVLALRQNRLFSVLNYETPDPECPILVANGRPLPPGDTFINLSVTPQGQASAVLVGRGRD